MPHQLNGFAPLTGVVFAVATLVAFASAPGAPSSSATGQRVISFYEAHQSSAQLSDYLWMIGFAFLVMFAAMLRRYLAEPAPAGALSSLMLAGAVLFAGGATVYFGFDFALAAVPNHLEPGAAQALNVLALNMWLPVSGGGFVFALASGLTIVRSNRLPKWLGWVAVAIGILALTPALVFALPVLSIWTATTAILVRKRAKTAELAIA